MKDLKTILKIFDRATYVGEKLTKLILEVVTIISRVLAGIRKLRVEKSFKKLVGSIEKIIKNVSYLVLSSLRTY